MIVGIGPVRGDADDRAAVPRRHWRDHRGPRSGPGRHSPTDCAPSVERNIGNCGRGTALPPCSRRPRSPHSTLPAPGLHTGRFSSRHATKPFAQRARGVTRTTPKPRWHELISGALRRLLKAWSPQAKSLQAWSLFGGHYLGVRSRSRSSTRHRRDSAPETRRKAHYRPRIGDHFRRHQDLCDLLRIRLRLALGVGFEIRLGIGFGRASPLGSRVYLTVSTPARIDPSP